MPRVSVVIPAFNAGPFIREAVGSVIRQSFRDHEIIVIDDGSTDDTAQALGPYVEECGVKYVRTENRGPAAARNTGLALCRGELIAFLDADDLWLPSKLARQMEILEADQDAAWVCSGVVVTRDGVADERLTSLRQSQLDRAETLVAKGRGFEACLYHKFIITSTVVMKREVYEKVGNWNERFRRAEDGEFFLRAARRYPIAIVPELLVVKRLHGANLTNEFDEHALPAAAAMLASLAEWRPPLAGAELLAYRTAARETYTRLALHYIARGNKKEARRWLGRAGRRLGIGGLLWLASWMPHGLVRTLKQAAHLALRSVGERRLKPL